mmetsp:Transcript_83834/g.186148  ORF Transcript_83834/g.186148 Transcript_83834/m.186148 type:complete len:257 (-) Transcript_83834:192-962(-)
MRSAATLSKRPSDCEVSTSLQGLNCTVPLMDISWITLNSTRPAASSRPTSSANSDPKPAARRRCRGTPWATSCSRTRLARWVLKESASSARQWPSMQSFTSLWSFMTFITPCRARVAKEDIIEEPEAKVTRSRTSTSTAETATARCSKADASAASGSRCSTGASCASGGAWAVSSWCRNSSASASALRAAASKSAARADAAADNAQAPCSSSRTAAQAMAASALRASSSSLSALAFCMCSSMSARPLSRRVCTYRS